MDKLSMYEVVVGNVGLVCSTTQKSKAVSEYKEYVKLSEAGRGRAAGESVTLICDGEIEKEFNPNAGN